MKKENFVQKEIKRKIMNMMTIGMRKKGRER
jgi:hypothetical protein